MDQSFYFSFNLIPWKIDKVGLLFLEALPKLDIQGSSFCLPDGTSICTSLFLWHVNIGVFSGWLSFVFPHTVWVISLLSWLILSFLHRWLLNLFVVRPLPNNPCSKFWLPIKHAHLNISQVSQTQYVINDILKPSLPSDVITEISDISSPGGPCWNFWYALYSSPYPSPYPFKSKSLRLTNTWRPS